MAEQILEREALQFTDLTGEKTGCKKKGSNKFWIGMVVKRDDGLCDYRCQWGTTGTEGSTNGSKFGLSEEKARKTLASKLKSKIKKGYTSLGTRSKDEETAKAAAKGVDLNGKGKKKPVVVKARAFQPEVERLMSIIYNSNSATVRSGLSDTAGATEDNPIGNLSDSQLDIGGGILDEISTFLEREFGREESSNRSSTVPLLSSGLPAKKIIDLTNRYLSNVPRAIPSAHRGMANIHRIVVSSYERLEEQRKFLQLLRDAHLSQATFQVAASQGSQGSKVAVWYDGLGCEVEHLARGDADYKWVLNVFDTKQSKKNSNWWRGGKSRLRVKNVWRFTRNGSSDRFDTFAKKIEKKPGALGRIFGWHGTRTENLLGIGKSGLLMPENLPRGVHISGKAFGAGIYHAPAWNATKTDMVGRYPTDGTNGALKSMNYTSARGAHYGSSNTANGAFMFLQEIAVGVPQVCLSACWNQKRPKQYPEQDWMYANAKRGDYLAHDEIVTFDEDAQVFRYMVEIETN